MHPLRNVTTRASVPYPLEKIVLDDVTSTVTYAIDESSAEIRRLILKSRGYVRGSSHIRLRLNPIELSSMICKSALAIALSLSPCAALCQTEGGTLPAETPLALRIDEHLPMRNGQPVRAHLIYPIYGNDKLLLPKDTIVAGSIVDLRSDHPRRVRAVMGGDFTPFHKPVVRFTSFVFPDGTTIPFTSDDAADGAPIFRAIATPPAKGGFLRRQFDGFLNVARNDVAIFTGPEKGDRFVQFLYTQIPYHPQRIEKGTAWTIETSHSVELPAESAPPALAVAADPPPKRHFWEQPLPPADPARTDNGSWILQANLDEPLSSETSKNGQAIKATVAEPIFNPDHTIAIPQGSTLVGTITRAKPSRKFGRTGVLTFNFGQLQVPHEETRTVETRLTGADSARDIALNSEGQAKSKPQDKISLPILLALMASRPLDQDAGRNGVAGGGNGLGKNATGGAAGLGLVGTVIGLSGGSPNAAAAIGYYGAARAVYYRWIAHGQKIDFAKNTRIVVETTPRRSAPMKSDQQP
jgi:hypothetical protein